MLRFWRKKKTEDLAYVYSEDGREQVMTKSEFIEKTIEQQKEKARNYQSGNGVSRSPYSETEFFLSRWHL